MLYTEIPTERPVTPLLNGIDHPQQLRQLVSSQLEQVADELRQYILYAVGQSGGHFGANLLCELYCLLSLNCVDKSH